MKQNIFIVASGTGGHVIPAKNIACLLLDSNYLVTWIGTRHGIENKIVNDKRIDFKYLNSSGIRGKSLFNMLKGFLNLFRSSGKCQINLLFLPITLFSEMAAIIVIICFLIIPIFYIAKYLIQL